MPADETALSRALQAHGNALSENAERQGEYERFMQRGQSVLLEMTRSRERVMRTFAVLEAEVAISWYSSRYSSLGAPSHEFRPYIKFTSTPDMHDPSSAYSCAPLWFAV